MSRDAPFRLDPAAGLAAYRAACSGFAAVAADVGADDWSRPSACDGWSALDVVGHVVCVARWHHEWLDRAEAGNRSPPFPLSELAERNAAALSALEISAGPDRVTAFVELTVAYADRVAAHWDLPYTYPPGTVSAGVHAVLAAGEWQLHAWDLAGAIDRDHHPDAALIRATWLALDRPVAAFGDAFDALLACSGRH
jgi:uncharacterized protein (TIGR03083 family)